MTTFTNKDLRPLKSIIDAAFKQQIGLNWNFSKAVFHGPIKQGRLGQIQFHTLQEYKQTQLFLGTIQNQDEIEELVQASLESE